MQENKEAPPVQKTDETIEPKAQQPQAVRAKVRSEPHAPCKDKLDLEWDG